MELRRRAKGGAVSVSAGACVCLGARSHALRQVRARSQRTRARALRARARCQQMPAELESNVGHGVHQRQRLPLRARGRPGIRRLRLRVQSVQSGASGRSRYRRTVVSAHDTAAVTFKLGCALTFVFLACALWEVFLLPLRARRMHSVSSAGCAPSRPPCPGKAMAQTPVGCIVPQLIAQDPEGTKVYIYSKYHRPANCRGFADSGSECTVCGALAGQSGLVGPHSTRTTLPHRTSAGRGYCNGTLFSFVFVPNNQ